MKNLLIVIDMQNDFVTGSLGTKEAQAIVEPVTEKVRAYIERGDEIIFTRDTHPAEYLETQEGKRLPVEHCIKDTKGWEIIEVLSPFVTTVFDKPTFGSLELLEYVRNRDYAGIELVGLCTDICVVSNALLLKAGLPETTVAVDAACCAGVTPKSHEAALTTMEMCQVEVKRTV